MGVEHALLLAGAAFLPCLGALRWHWSHGRNRFFTIVEGKFFRSGAMKPAQLKRIVGKHGIRAVVDLRSARKAVDIERSVLSELGVAYFHIPSKQLPVEDTVAAVLAVLDREENRPALIHCNHGVRRAAQFEAVCRMEYQNWTNRQALFRLRFRSGFLSFRPGSRGEAFVQGYVPRRGPSRVIAA